jgi:hypothetical protein
VKHRALFAVRVPFAFDGFSSARLAFVGGLHANEASRACVEVGATTHEECDAEAAKFPLQRCMESRPVSWESRVQR